MLQMGRTEELSCCALVPSCNRRTVDTNEREKIRARSDSYLVRLSRARDGMYFVRPGSGRSRSVLGLPPWMLIGTVLIRT